MKRQFKTKDHWVRKARILARNDISSIPKANSKPPFDSVAFAAALEVLG